jgi:hypothetical protein
VISGRDNLSSASAEQGTYLPNMSGQVPLHFALSGHSLRVFCKDIKQFNESLFEPQLWLPDKKNCIFSQGLCLVLRFVRLTIVKSAAQVNQLAKTKS